LDPRKATLSDLRPADLLEWRLSPISGLLLEHLLNEQAASLEYIAARTRRGDARRATLATGGLMALRSLWDKLHPPEPPVSEPEEKYDDPATIREPQR
jgi:hypothetical protein